MLIATIYTPCDPSEPNGDLAEYHLHYNEDSDVMKYTLVPYYGDRIAGSYSVEPTLSRLLKDAAEDLRE